MIHKSQFPNPNRLRNWKLLHPKLNLAFQQQRQSMKYYARTWYKNRKVLLLRFGQNSYLQNRRYRKSRKRRYIEASFLDRRKAVAAQNCGLKKEKPEGMRVYFSYNFLIQNGGFLHWGCPKVKRNILSFLRKTFSVVYELKIVVVGY